MDNSVIYENIMMTIGLNRIKAIRDRWDSDKMQPNGLSTIIDIGGNDYRSYRYIMEQCHDVILDVIPDLIVELMKAYNISAQFYGIEQKEAHIYTVKDNGKWSDYVGQSNSKNILVFVYKGDSKEGLYVVKEYGMGNQFPESLLQAIKSSCEVKHHYYISLVDTNAYTEIINHNDNVDDPTRGTGIYSLKQFFDLFFDAGEYASFKEYANRFTETVRTYFGLEIVRTLKPNTMHDFRMDIKRRIEEFDISKHDVDLKVTNSQRNLIAKQFYKESNYELLIGSSDFAQSFMTAEWLFFSLGKAGNIDLTAIAMGYFKAIEQFLFQYIKLHVKESDSVTRTIYVKRRETYVDNKGYAELTKSLLEDEEKAKHINLGALTGFFGYYAKDKNTYYHNNQDLLQKGIETNTYEFIIDVLSKISELRNVYFHKQNLQNWDCVIKARDNAMLVFFLMLGSYKINNAEKRILGLLQTDNHDDYYQLCKYLDETNSSVDGLKVPIYYMGGGAEKNDFWMGVRDSFIKYDAYGEPIYSGVYFRRMSEKKNVLKMSKNDLPSEIWQGVFKISRSIPIKFEVSGPQKQIFGNGKFML